MRIKFGVISLLLIVAIGASAVGNRPATASSSSVRQEAPKTQPIALPDSVMNTELNSLDGGTIRLSDYRGKVVLVNLWATWCGPCRSEIPQLVKVSQEFRARGVVVIGVNTEDSDTDLENVRDFIKDYKVTYEIVWGDQNFVLGLMQGKVRNNIPQTFVISRDGRVLKRFVGFSNTETPPKLHQALEDALK